MRDKHINIQELKTLSECIVYKALFDIHPDLSDHSVKYANTIVTPNLPRGAFT